VLLCMLRRLAPERTRRSGTPAYKHQRDNDYLDPESAHREQGHHNLRAPDVPLKMSG